MKFNFHTDQWFDRVAAYAARYEAGEAANVTDVLRRVAERPASRTNIARLAEVARHVGIPELEDHVQAVLRRVFRSEFRFSFSRHGHQVSAASSLFDKIEQAVNAPARAAGYHTAGRRP